MKSKDDLVKIASRVNAAKAVVVRARARYAQAKQDLQVKAQARDDLGSRLSKQKERVRELATMIDSDPEELISAVRGLESCEERRRIEKDLASAKSEFGTADAELARSVKDMQDSIAVLINKIGETQDP